MKRGGLGGRGAETGEGEQEERGGKKSRSL